VLHIVKLTELQCCDAAGNVHIDAGRYETKPTKATTDHRSALKIKPHFNDGVAAQLVISIPVISWASRAPNPRRRTVCVAASARHFQSAPDNCTAVSRDHPRRSKSPWPDLERPRDHRHSHSYNYGRSWYDGLDQLD